MIQDVFLDHSTYNEPPNRFEAGTPAIAEAIGLAAACDYLSAVGMDVVEDYEKQLADYLYDQVTSLQRLQRVHVRPAVLIVLSSCFTVQHATSMLNRVLLGYDSWEVFT